MTCDVCGAPTVLHRCGNGGLRYHATDCPHASNCPHCGRAGRPEIDTRRATTTTTAPIDVAPAPAPEMIATRPELEAAANGTGFPGGADLLPRRIEAGSYARDLLFNLAAILGTGAAASELAIAALPPAEETASAVAVLLRGFASPEVLERARNWAWSTYQTLAEGVAALAPEATGTGGGGGLGAIVFDEETPSDPPDPWVLIREKLEGRRGRWYLHQFLPGCVGPRLVDEGTFRDVADFVEGIGAHIATVGFGRFDLEVYDADTSDEVARVQLVVDEAAHNEAIKGLAPVLPLNPRGGA